MENPRPLIDLRPSMKMYYELERAENLAELNRPSLLDNPAVYMLAVEVGILLAVVGYALYGYFNA